MKKIKASILIFLMAIIYPISVYTISSIDYSILPILPKNETLSTNAGARYNDSLYGDQWAMPTVGAHLAHAMNVTGKNLTNPSDPIVVAVCDTGIDTNHPDLVGNIIGNISFVPEEALGEDYNGHGTHCAGIIAATMNNTRGIVGVAPEAKIRAYKVLNRSGEGEIDYLRQAIDDIVANYPPNKSDGLGVNVISMSLGVFIEDYDALSPAKKLVYENLNSSINNAYAAGIILLAAAGNNKKGIVCYPAAFPNVLAITAVDVFQHRASYSNWGPEVNYTAPGGDLWNDFFLVGVLSTYKGGGYAYMAGTSMATPVAAGVVALLFGNGTHHTNITKELTARAKPKGAPGWDPVFGDGLVQIVASDFDYKDWFWDHYMLDVLLVYYTLFGAYLEPETEINWVMWAIIGGVIAFFAVIAIYEMRAR
ncbi:MAG: S8 family serine peptidase [Candidatus Helarchaeota archaeon]|nr:S8 family serine peptidase [Candidatus Helarchaeota archaeon]